MIRKCPVCSAESAVGEPHPPATVTAFSGDPMLHELERIYAEHEQHGLVRTIRFSDGSPLFHRAYLGGRRGDGAAKLHRLVASDLPVHHNHPWDVSVSLILHGSYVEHRLGREPRRFVAGDTNVIYGNDFHWLELDQGECWTLFTPGTRTQGWGFAVPQADGSTEFVDHREYDR